MKRLQFEFHTLEEACRAFEESLDIVDAYKEKVIPIGGFYDFPDHIQYHVDRAVSALEVIGEAYRKNTGRNMMQAFFEDELGCTFVEVS